MSDIPTPTAVDDADIEADLMHAIHIVVAIVGCVAAIGFSLGVLSVRLGMF